MISQKAKYALRALSALARAEAGEPLQISDIADRQNIPKKFLEQILLDLKRNGLVTSRRGKQGGYLLLRPAAEITYGEVLRLIDGPIAPLPCLSRRAYQRCEDCPDEETCRLRKVFGQVFWSYLVLIDSLTLADLVGPAESANPTEAARQLGV